MLISRTIIDTMKAKRNQAQTRAGQSFIPRKELEQACLLLAILPEDLQDRIGHFLGAGELNRLNDTARHLSTKPAWQRKRILLEALQNARLAPILAQGETQRINRIPHKTTGTFQTLRKSLLEGLDPRVWFYFRKENK